MSLSPYQQFARTSLLRWQRAKHFAQYDMLPRMSWHPYNLYNVYSRSTTYQPELWQRGRSKISIHRTVAKRLVHGYHSQHVTTRQLRFKYLRPPPTYRIKVFKRDRSSDPVIRGFSDSYRLPEVPYSSMMFSEVERRLDTVLFRSCLVPSIYEARTLISKGYVRVEDTIVRSPAHEMQPGAMFSVEPRRLRFRAFKELHLGQYLFEEAGLILPPNVDPRATPEEVSRYEEQSGRNGPIGGLPQNQSDRYLDASGEGNDVAAYWKTDAGDKDTAESDPIESLAQSDGEESSGEGNSYLDEGIQKRQKNEQRWRALTSDELDRVRPHRTHGELHYHFPNWAAASIFMPAYLEVNFRACAGIYVRHPTAKPGVSEIPSPWDSLSGDMFQLFYEAWRPLLKTHRKRPVLPPGMKRSPWKRDANRMRNIGEGDARAIEYVSHLREASRESDEADVRSRPEAEQAERRHKIQTLRELRQRRYVGSRLASQAVPNTKAGLLPRNLQRRDPES